MSSKPKRILVVEDNELNLDMLKRRLDRLGYEVLVATDGANGVQTAVEGQPDIILMDMSLPLMDGWEATRQLKNNDATRSIPIIGLSAHAMSEDKARALDAGCEDYETKPVHLNRLLAKIEKLTVKDVPDGKSDGSAAGSR
jgi:CheY-like chemotaxis protein